tara:strand:+ start:2167 stop:2403 length:237 start_codon:yes stop_codon:yes gene_type:complete
MALSIVEKVSLNGIISFLEDESEQDHEEVIVKFLKRKLNYVIEMKETLQATSKEEDQMKARYSKALYMAGKNTIQGGV